MEYILIRSKRKTVAIHVRDGVVEVRAPLNMLKCDIDDFVASKERWIKEKLAVLRERFENREAFTLNYGDIVTYRGKNYPVTAKKGNRVGFDDESFFIPPDLPAENVKSACIQIYRMLARRDLTEKTVKYAKVMGIDPANVRVTNAKSRWGSCSAKKSINYSWRLIMADDDVVDYVVVHELAHLYEMNHGELFWARIESVMPDYRDRRLRLRELHRRIENEDWD